MNIKITPRCSLQTLQGLWKDKILKIARNDDFGVFKQEKCGACVMQTKIFKFKFLSYEC